MNASDLPILTANQLHARDAEGERGASRGRVTCLDLELGPGVFAIVGAPEDGTLAVTGAACGRYPPLRGKLTVLGQSPSKSAAIRARIGVLSSTPQLPAAATVRRSLELALRARGESGSAIDAVLDPLGLSSLHARRTTSLSYGETRAIELALALTNPAPRLLVLHEPGCDLALLRLGDLRERLAALAHAGVCVLVTTSSSADARALTDRVAQLTRGTLTWPLAADEAPSELVVTVRAGLRLLAAELERCPDITALAWQEVDAARAVLRVRGAELDACALALTLAIDASGAVVEAITRASAAWPRAGAHRP
jgi:ABC-2 type transport system ATP-binding protein